MNGAKQETVNIGQAGKFIFSGLVTNASVYVAYLLLTVAGIGHKTAMSLMFVAGMLLSYNMNKHWTFAGHRTHDAAFWRFMTAYAGAYVLNLLSMLVLVDHLGIPHYWVQGVNIVVISALLFIAQKYWIFKADHAVPGGSHDKEGR
jgi:putative flippase GtrA